MSPQSVTFLWCFVRELNDFIYAFPERHFCGYVRIINILIRGSPSHIFKLLLRWYSIMFYFGVKRNFWLTKFMTSHYCLLAPHICIVVLCAHPVRGESHIQRKATGEIATTFTHSTTNRTERTFLLWRLNPARPPHSGHSTILLRSESPSGICAKVRIVAAGNNRFHMPWSLCYCLLAPHICIVVLCAHPVRGESHIQRNATREVATTPPAYHTCTELIFSISNTSDKVSRLASVSRHVSRPLFRVSVSKVSGLVSVSVSKDFGLGLELLVSRLCMSFYLWSLAQETAPSNADFQSNCSQFSRSTRPEAINFFCCYAAMEKSICPLPRLKFFLNSIKTACVPLKQ